MELRAVGWLREPLARFLLIGIGFLAVDHAVRDRVAVVDDAPRIIVSASRRDTLAEAFRAEHGRMPRAEELQALLDHWIDEEVLYREAVALGLDRGDTVVQRQLTQKMRFLIEDATLLPAPATAELEEWLARHPERYGRGPLVSFEQVFVSRGRHGERLAAEADRIVAELRSAPDAFVGVGDPFLVGQIVADTDPTRLRRDFGAGFAEALVAAPAGTWFGPVVSAFGLHLVRVTARAPFAPATLAEVAERVRVDLDLARREERNRAAIAELRGRYRVAVEGAAG